MPNVLTYTEGCCRNGGSNLNAGTRRGDSTVPGTSADLTYAAGSWTNSTRTFTPAGGADPVADGVTVGDYVAIDTGGSTAVMIGIVASVTTTTLVLDGSFAGTNPADGTYTARVGGAWSGPSGGSGFPLDVTSIGNVISRINLKNDQTYSLTAAITTTVLSVCGFSTSYDDLARATIDGGSSGASYTLLTVSGNGSKLKDLIFQNNGATGSVTGVVLSGNCCQVENCLIQHMRGSGISCSGTEYGFVRCEAYDCNTSNTSGLGGFEFGSSTQAALTRCVSHGHSGSNGHGFIGGLLTSFHRCIVADCGGRGFSPDATNSSTALYHCIAYGNAVALRVGGALGSWTSIVENCLFEANTTVYSAASNGGRVRAINCGYYNNTNKFSSTGQVTNFEETAPLTGGATFFADAANGDFELTPGSVARGAGAGSFPTAAYSGTSTGAPDVGAVQTISTTTTIDRGAIFIV